MGQGPHFLALDGTIWRWDAHRRELLRDHAAEDDRRTMIAEDARLAMARVRQDLAEPEKPASELPPQGEAQGRGEASTRRGLFGSAKRLRQTSGAETPGPVPPEGVRPESQWPERGPQGLPSGPIILVAERGVWIHNHAGWQEVQFGHPMITGSALPLPEVG